MADWPGGCRSGALYSIKALRRGRRKPLRRLYHVSAGGNAGLQSPACSPGRFPAFSTLCDGSSTPVTITTPEELEKMRIAGRLAAEVLEMIAPHIQPGVTTEELDRLCHNYMVEVQGCIPAPLNYHGFPKSICT